MKRNYYNKKLKINNNIKYKILLYFIMENSLSTIEKFTVTIYKGNIAPITISHFNKYLDAYAFVYRYVNTYFTNVFITSYSDTYKNLCSASIPIISVPYPNQKLCFEIYISRGHNILTQKDYIWNLIHPAEALTLSPVGHITDILLDYTNKPSLLQPKYFNVK